jgi:hypothetical protein
VTIVTLLCVCTASDGLGADSHFAVGIFIIEH